MVLLYMVVLFYIKRVIVSTINILNIQQTWEIFQESMKICQECECLCPKITVYTHVLDKTSNNNSPF